MNSTSNKIKAYLERIGINNEITPTIRTLRQIQKQHLLTVPFENLDIHIHQEIMTDIPTLFDKIVNNNRGGICYELNWMLYSLLSGLGFKTKVIGAKVTSNGDYFDHMLLVVTLDQTRYLVDVGFGDNFLEPLEFNSNMVQKDYKGLFKIIQVDENQYKVTKYDHDSGEYREAYTFLYKERDISEFKKRMNYFVHSEDSLFRKNLFCSLEQVNGRISLKQNKLTVTKNGVREVQLINAYKEYVKHLADFNISLDEYEQERLLSKYSHI